MQIHVDPLGYVYACLSGRVSCVCTCVDTCRRTCRALVGLALRGSFVWFVLYRKMLSAVVSMFTSAYITNWPSFFPVTSMPLKSAPYFDGKLLCLPTNEAAIDYFRWRQIDCTYTPSKLGTESRPRGVQGIGAGRPLPSFLVPKKKSRWRELYLDPPFSLYQPRHAF